MGIRKRRLLRRLYDRPVLLALLAACPGLASAQAGPAAAALPPPQQLPVERSAAAAPPEQAIIITGSRIPQPNLTAASPVATITSQEVKFEGATNAEELLNQLPQ